MYADIMDNTVYRVKPDGEGSAPILVTHNDGLIAMSYDWVSKQLYYLDNIRNALEVVKVTDQVGQHFCKIAINYSNFFFFSFCSLFFRNKKVPTVSCHSVLSTLYFRVLFIPINWLDAKCFLTCEILFPWLSIHLRSVFNIEESDF